VLGYLRKPEQKRPRRNPPTVLGTVCSSSTIVLAKNCSSPKPFFVSALRKKSRRKFHHHRGRRPGAQNRSKDSVSIGRARQVRRSSADLNVFKDGSIAGDAAGDQNLSSAMRRKNSAAGVEIGLGFLVAGVGRGRTDGFAVEAGKTLRNMRSADLRYCPPRPITDAIFSAI